MKLSTLNCLLLIAGLFLSLESKSQSCTVNALTSADTITCGSCATLSAYGQGQGQIVFHEDFNTGTYGSGWVATDQAMWNNPCSASGVDGTTHVWMGNTSPVPRILQTQSYNLSTATAGVTLCFDMLFAEQGNTAPCEGPDEPQEGVYLQYSINGGTTWINIDYYDPNGGNDPQYINWTNRCYALPAAAITSATQFRWFQDADSGADYDHWGIDNVNIFMNDPTYQIVYQHDMYNMGASGGVDPNVVCPHVTTTYTVIMSNTLGNTCTATVTVNVEMPVINVSAGPDVSICPGQSGVLNGQAEVIVSPAKTPTYENNQITAVTSGNVSVNINITDLNMQQVLPNSITEVCINNFTFSGTQLCTSFGGCNCNGTPIAMGATCNLNTSSFNVILHSPNNACSITMVPQGIATGTSYSNVCFVPAGGQAIAAPNFPGTGGPWNPNQPLSNLNGCTANGVWSLEFDAPGGLGFGIGSLTGWNITFDDPEISYPANFTWSPTTNMTNSTTLTPTITTPGAATTYTITASDTAGCVTNSDNVNIINNCCNFTHSAVVTQPTCGATNGAINVTVAPAGSYSYLWSNAATTQDLSSIGAGTFSVTIHDITNNCDKDTTFVLSNPGSPSVTVVSTNATCGSSNGSATANASGGTGAYTYAWSNGGTASLNSGLAAGTYTVTVTANGCSTTGSATITGGSLPTVNVTVTNAACGASDGSATATAGGSTSYNYLWNDGQTTATATGLSAGSCTVTVTDNFGCTVTGVGSISSFGGASISVNVVDTPCIVNSGLATVTASGGTPPYQYLWNTGATTTSINNLAGGTYSIAVTDQSGCVTSLSATIPPQITVTAQILNPTHVACFGGFTGSATVTGGGGTAPYTYFWSNGQTTATATGLNAGLHAVTVVDDNGCFAGTSTSIQQPTALSATIVGTNVLCFGGSTGAATLTVSGGTGASTFLWSNAATTQNLSGISIGLYTVTATDANSCTANASVTITQSAAITSAIVPTAVLCNGGSTGNANLTTTGGTLPFTYVWSNGAGTEDLNAAVAGTYSVVATDANSCTTNASVTITEPAILAVTALGANVLCNGGNSGSVTTTVTGGVTPYTYVWSNGLISPNLTTATAGPYTVTVKDVNLCTASFSVTITQPLLLAATATGTTNQCFGDFTGAATLTVTGGTPTCTYVWSNGQTTQNLSAVQAGTYIVTVKDANNCTVTASAVITQPQALSATISHTNVSCNGGSDGNATVTADDGTTPYTYSWNTIPVQTLATATSLMARGYSVTVTDANLCTASANISITEPIALVATATSTNTSCFNGSNGTADLTVSGGTIPYVYNWSNTATTQDLTGLPTGTYNVNISDAHLCGATTSVTVTQPTQLTTTQGTVTNLSCFGGSDGQASVIASGGTAPYAYSWSTNPALNQPSATNLPAGNVVVTVIDFKQCMATQTILLTEPQQITSSPSSDATICKGSSSTLSLMTMGGTLPYTSHWNTGENTSSILVSPDSTTTYSCYVTDGNNCIGGTQTVTVFVLPPVQLDAVTYDNSICPDDSAEIHLNISNGVAPYLLTLADGAVISTPYYASMQHTGIVKFFVKDKCNSFDTASIIIVVYPVPTVHVIADKYTGCSPFTVNFHETSLNAGQSYIWSFDNEDENNLSLAKNPSHTFDIAGSYDVSLTVTSVNGCKRDTTLRNFILVHPLPDARFIFNPSIPKIIAPKVEFTNLSSGYVESYWSFGDGDSSLVTNPEHIYRSVGGYDVKLVVMTDKGCTDTSIQIVNVQDFHTLYAPTAFSPDKDNKNDMFYVYGSGIMEGTFKLMIYDRWGEIMFQSNDILNGWDGKISGQKVKIGSYVWLAVFKDFMGNEKTATGQVTVLR